jgi:UDP-N-acetylglucosamine transferase subunit ALG13
VIFLTIGTQLPFNRLVHALDDLAPRLPLDIFAQIGQSDYAPANIKWSAFLAPAEFDVKFRAASVIISHAGIGTVLSAQKHRKPLIVVPRLARFGEHRNDHQIATARQLQGKRGVYVANDIDELPALLNRDDLEAAGNDMELPGREHFVSNIRSYLMS